MADAARERVLRWHDLARAATAIGTQLSALTAKVP
jgi:hypothetical protein